MAGGSWKQVVGAGSARALASRAGRVSRAAALFATAVLSVSCSDPASDTGGSAPDIAVPGFDVVFFPDTQTQPSDGNAAGDLGPTPGADAGSPQDGGTGGFDAAQPGTDATSLADATGGADVAGDSGGSGTGSDAAASGCEFASPAAPGEPGAPCNAAKDCNSGACVDTGDGKICTRTCVSCCPTGYQCAQQSATDSVFLCLPKSVAQCRPCVTDGECDAASAGARCLDYGAALGRFCGSPCDSDADCPGGSACQVSKGTSAAGKYCVRTNGECTCNAKATLDGASTVCTQVNEQGSCSGKRTCSAAGLGACTAAIPAAETCNNTDDDCDGQTDEGAAVGCVNYYPDADGDGAGTGSAQCSCSSPGLGWAPQAGDCNDASSAIGPDAVETCNGKDDDCDGQTDNGFADLDKDGSADCVDTDTDGDGVANPADCAPLDPSLGIAAPEACNGKDDDCDGQTDEASAAGCTDYFVDADQDGAGSGAAQCSCAAPGAGWATKAGDCNDALAAVVPGADDACNGTDDDCDGATDEGFADLDKDGVADCADPDIDGDGASNQTDCAPLNPALATPSPEVCNGADDDCDGNVDELGSTGCILWYVDGDGDGVAANGAAAACLCAASLPYAVSQTGDCADGIPAVKPGAAEICDGLDNNCDGVTDTGCDVDGDGWCAAAVPAGTVGCLKGGGDCNDASQAIAPDAPEVCGDGVDNNCDAQTDTGIDPVGCSNWWQDADGDGAGSGDSVCRCGAQGNYTVGKGNDCSPQDPKVFPGATELCNGVDDDCDGETDESGAADCKEWYPDADQDGFGAAGAAVCRCAAGDGYVVQQGGDCNDLNDDVFPSAPEVCDGVDNDCNGATDPANADGCTAYYVDADADGFGQQLSASKCLCAAAGTYSAVIPGDCNDANQLVFPGQVESCDQGVDNNCDGSADLANSQGCAQFYVDVDGDGYGQTSVSQCLCKLTAPYTAVQGGDCNDGNALVTPVSTEICNQQDDNCDGQTDEGQTSNIYYADVDKDGFGDPTTGVTSCTAVSGRVLNATDCDDSNASRKPGATEISCNGVDEDCSGADLCACTPSLIQGFESSITYTETGSQWWRDSWLKSQGSWSLTFQYDPFACGYNATTVNGETATFTITVPVGAQKVALDVLFRNWDDYGGADNTAQMTIDVGGKKVTVGPFATRQNDIKLIEFVADPAWWGKSVTVKVRMDIETTVYDECSAGFAVDNIRATCN